MGQVVARKGHQREPFYWVVVGEFCRLWEERYGKPYRPTARDRGQLELALSDLHVEERVDIPLCFVRYLADMSPWVAQAHRHSLACFCSSGGFNKYRVVAPAISDRAARTKTAMEQWLESREGSNGQR